MTNQKTDLTNELLELANVSRIRVHESTVNRALYELEKTMLSRTVKVEKSGGYELVTLYSVMTGHLLIVARAKTVRDAVNRALTACPAILPLYRATKENEDQLRSDDRSGISVELMLQLMELSTQAVSQALKAHNELITKHPELRDMRGVQ